MELSNILICPESHNSLRLDTDASRVRVEGTDTVYPVINCIIDFCNPQPDRISASYDKIAPRYDACLTSSTLPMKLCNRIIWGSSDDERCIDTVLSYLPDDFDGVLLDVPVGTGVFTASVYAKYPNAMIIGVDASMGMLHKAKERFDKEGVKNIRLIRADATHLPIADGAVDIVLFMNGLHVFTDKQRAIAEMSRVLKKQGRLIACGYIQGVNKRWDWVVKHLASKRGFFNPPYFTLENLEEQLAGFTITRRGNVGALIYFEAINNKQDK